MPLSSIKLPADDVRLIQFEDTVFKVKLTYDSGDGGAFLPCSKSQLNHQVEQVLRAVLYAKQFDILKIKTDHFYVDCSLYKWEALRLIAFKKDNVRLNAGPSVIALRFKPHGLHASTANTSDSRQGVGQPVKQPRQVPSQRSTEQQPRRSPRVHQTGADQETNHHEPPPDSQDNPTCRPEESHPGRSESDRTGKVLSRWKVSSAEREAEENPKKKSKQREDKKRRTASREHSSDSELEELVQVEKKRVKRSHRLPLQFLESSPKMLRIDMGERLSDADLRRHRAVTDASDRSLSSGDHRASRRKPRVQIDLGSAGEGSDRPNKPNKSELNDGPPRSRSASPVQTRGSKSSDYNKNPQRSHTMTTRPKPKTPPKTARPRRRSSFSGYLEDFLDHFW